MSTAQKYNVTFSTIKSVISKLPSYYITQGDGGYKICSIGDESIITALILGSNSTDKNDFDTNYKSSCTATASEDDALVLGKLANNIPFVYPKDPNGIPLSVSEPRKGDEVIYATHNLCDKTTWFGDSVRVVDEVLTDSGDGYTFTSLNTFWIDMISGRVLNDDDVADEQRLLNPEDPHGYQVIIKINGVEAIMRTPFLDSGGDYEVYWDDGYVKFFEDQSGNTITASYSYATTSTYYVRPLPGKVLYIEAAEADFSYDIVQKDTIEYSVWGYVDAFAPQLIPLGVPSGTKIKLKKSQYKRYTQIVKEAIGSYPVIDANAASSEHLLLNLKEFRRVSRGAKTKTQAVPFRYATTRDLYSSAGLELRVKLVNDTPFDGEFVSLTLYCTYKDE